MSNRLDALHSSVSHLREIIESLHSDAHVAPAYPAEWTIADTMSHIGSGAVIMRQRFLDALNASTPDENFNQSVWDEWNAKEPSSQVRDALVADQAMLDALRASTDEQRASFRLSFGPFDLDFDRFVGLRLAEHVLHTWDVEVTINPGAVLAEPAAGLLLDQVHFVAGRSGRSDSQSRTVAVHTTNPDRDFNVVFADNSIELLDTTHDAPADLTLPAEAFVRLVYGRLDDLAGLDDHAQVHLEHLRLAFPGF